MCLRYSSSVVAPIIRSSPRASIGLIMLPASIAPSAAPAPTMVCNSSTNVMTSPAASVISFSTAFNRSSNSPRYLAPASIDPMSSEISRLLFRPFGHVAIGDALSETLDDGGLADAGLADQHRVVLGAPAEHLDDAADLVVATDDRIDLAVAGALGEVLPVLLEGGEVLLRGLTGDPVAAANFLQGLQQLLAADAESLVHGQQQVLDRQEVVLQILLVGLGVLDDVVELAVHPRIVAAVGLRQLLYGLVGLVAHHQRSQAELGQHCRHDRVVLAHQRRQQVVGRQLRVAQRLGLVDGRGKGLIRLQGPLLGIERHVSRFPSLLVSATSQ